MAYTWFILLFTLAETALVLLLLHKTSLGKLVHERIQDRPRRRLFVASLSFFLTFAGVRGVVYGVVHHIPPFHFIQLGGRHIHHLVLGIVILLLVGYGWLCEIGVGSNDSSIFLSRLMSILYGAGAALTLDEFALWLNLKMCTGRLKDAPALTLSFFLERFWPPAPGVRPCLIASCLSGNWARRFAIISIRRTAHHLRQGPG